MGMGCRWGDEGEVIGKTNGANEALRIEYPIRISDCILGGGFGIILPKGKDSHD